MCIRDSDKITLKQIKQIPGCTGLMGVLDYKAAGEVWEEDEIKKYIDEVHAAGLECEVIESVNVHEDIKLGLPTRDQYIENYCKSIRNLAKYGVKVIVYNFMPVLDWLRTDLALSLIHIFMNARSHVLGVVLLESTLRELGFAQVSSSDILLVSGALAFVLTVLLGALFSRMFTQPITAVQRFAGKLAGGEYEARMNSVQRDEIGELARSMDILARRLFEARSRDERLREQQSAFFATISHELKTPVTVIRGSLEALRDGVVSGGDDVRAYYNQMLTECKGLQRLIIDLLELSRLQNADFSLNMGSVDVRELLGDVAMSAGCLLYTSRCV